MKRKIKILNHAVFTLLVLVSCLVLKAEEINRSPSLAQLEQDVRQIMAKAKIPGLSIIMVRGEDVLIKNLGYADLGEKRPVTPGTLFELASCSKAFTALAVLRLESDGLIDPDQPVSHYLPWFYVQYQGKKINITLRQLLHHTSGIPTASLSLLPRDQGKEALEKTVKKIRGLELAHAPGKQFEYATINYDILGAVIEKVTGMSFEDYMSAKVFKPLGLAGTTVGVSTARHAKFMATGYKMGFLSPRKYRPPVFRGNNPAAYVISNATDIARWLKLQMGLVESAMTPLIMKTQAPDRTIPPNLADFSSYAMGWKVFQVGGGEVVHTGLNPNFSSYIGFKPERKIGVAVLCNLNSEAAGLIGNYLLKSLAGETNVKTDVSGSTIDKFFSLASLVLVIYLLLILAVLVLIIRGIWRHTHQFKPLNKSGLFLLAQAVLLCLPVLVGLYFFPRALAGFSWETIIVWSPLSLPATALLALAALGTSLVLFFLALLFPHKNRYINALPFVIILSTLAGLTNSVAVFIVIQSFSRKIAFAYLLLYFGIAVVLYISMSTLVRTRLIKITNHVVYDLRLRLIKEMLSTRYQKFEGLDPGRIYATINNDTGRIGDSPNLVVSLINNAVIILCIFIYLLTISFTPTLVTIGIIVLIVLAYFIVSKRVQVYMEQARDTQNVFMKQIDGMVKGFKELSLHFNRRKEYEQDLEYTCDDFRQKRDLALVKFIKLSIFIEAVLLSVLGFAGICFPVLFKDIQMYTLVSFVMILFYVAGPIANIMGGVPSIVQIRVSWNRIQTFLKEIHPVGAAAAKKERASLPGIPAPGPGLPLPLKKSFVGTLKTRGLTFAYEKNGNHDGFSVGPLDFEVDKGEVLFIIGGNGSGKTTLAKLLTGLYHRDSGQIEIDGKVIDSTRLGEHFSAVFSDFHLFERLYDIDVSQKQEKIKKYLKLLELEEKVHLHNGSFSTIDLSGGQRKRLALLLCYLEDCPIYLFDEWAADQDPTFRKFFYRHLLPEMKKEGKIVVAITHDDNYFDAADKILKMDLGQIQKEEYKRPASLGA